ncbi:MAG: hypothetical protein ACRBBM_12575 [Pseudomonadaceae bacterium]
MLVKQLEQEAEVAPQNHREVLLLRLFRQLDEQAQADMLYFMRRLAGKPGPE